VSWTEAAAEILARPDTPALLASSDLRQLVSRALVQAKAERTPSESTFQRWLDRISDPGGDAPLLTRVQRDLYRNDTPGHYVHPYAVVPRLRPTAVVSLQSVLGDAGVINNPSRVVFAVVDQGGPDGPRPREVANPAGEFRFLGMRGEIYHAGDERDRLDPSSDVPKATLERAFCDWLYLGHSRAHPTRGYPPLNIDLSDLDMDRVGRLSEAMGLREAMEKWMPRYLAAQDDPDFVQQVSSRLGF
jgi:hypothetical protein